jgi:hypothetical protein
MYQHHHFENHIHIHRHHQHYKKMAVLQTIDAKKAFDLVINGINLLALMVEGSQSHSQ